MAIVLWSGRPSLLGHVASPPASMPLVAHQRRPAHHRLEGDRPRAATEGPDAPKPTLGPGDEAPATSTRVGATDRRSEATIVRALCLRLPRSAGSVSRRNRPARRLSLDLRPRPALCERQGRPWTTLRQTFARHQVAPGQRAGSQTSSIGAASAPGPCPPWARPAMRQE